MRIERIILASASPRRSALLDQLGLAHEVLPANIDESVREGETAQRYTARLAEEKALAVRAVSTPNALIIAADTAIGLDEARLGKPEHVEAAVAMLAQLAGRAHDVFTAFALSSGDELHVESVRSRVWIAAGSEADWRAYCATGEPLDKAGAYAIQGLGARLVERLEGSYSNVVGLPLFELGRALDAFGINALGQE